MLTFITLHTIQKKEIVALKSGSGSAKKTVDLLIIPHILQDRHNQFTP